MLQADTAMLDAPKAGRLTIQYAPDNGATIFENPPRFSWLPVLEPEAQYVMRISSDPSFSQDVATYEGITLNFFTPDKVLPEGEYHWSYAVWSPETNAPSTQWSAPRAFQITAELPQTPLAARKSRYAAADMAHPRLQAIVRGTGFSRHP